MPEGTAYKTADPNTHGRDHGTTKHRQKTKAWNLVAFFHQPFQTSAPHNSFLVLVVSPRKKNTVAVSVEVRSRISTNTEATNMMKQRNMYQIKKKKKNRNPQKKTYMR